MRCLEQLLPLLEERGMLADGSVFVSSQQPFGDVASCLWHLRRGRTPKLWPLALLFAESGPLRVIADRNGWASEYQGLASQFREAIEALNRIRYHATEAHVTLGDRVELRVLFRLRTGRVTYLPGVSTTRDDIDFGGIFRVGIQVFDGPFVMVHVNPETLELKRGVRLLDRDPSPHPHCPTDEELRREA